MSRLAPLFSAETRLGRTVSLVIGVVILGTLVAVVVETIPTISNETRTFLEYFEYLSVALFSIEYLLRIAAAESKRRYIFSFLGLVDLAAVLPFYLGLAIDLRGLRALRVIRVVVLLKAARMSKAAERLRDAFREIRAELAVFGLTALIVLYVCGLGIYYFENEAQPDKFASALDGFWWAVSALTTVGYGDIYPITWGGRVFSAIVVLVGIGIVAVPTGLIAAQLTRTSDKP